MVTRALLLLTLLYGSQALAGQDATHAQLTDGPDSIEALLPLPKDLAAGRYVVQCEAWVGTKGRARRLTCYSPDADQRALAQAVRWAGMRAKFVSATREGKKVDVYMLLMVRIDTTQGEPMILAVPNNGADTARYGMSYSAPQRFNEFTWSGKTWVGHGRVLLWQKMRIDQDGKVLDYVVTNASGAPDWLVKRIEAQAKRMEFMPGYSQGKPVEMFYTEPVYD